MLSCIPTTIATGQKQTFGLLGKRLPTSYMYEFEQLEAMALGAIGPQGPCPMNQGAAEICATASSVDHTALAIKRKLIKAAR